MDASSRWMGRGRGRILHLICDPGLCTHAHHSDEEANEAGSASEFDNLLALPGRVGSCVFGCHVLAEHLCGGPDLASASIRHVELELDVPEALARVGGGPVVAVKGDGRACAIGIVADRDSLVDDRVALRRNKIVVVLRGG